MICGGLFYTDPPTNHTDINTNSAPNTHTAAINTNSFPNSGGNYGEANSQQHGEANSQQHSFGEGSDGKKKTLLVEEKKPDSEGGEGRKRNILKLPTLNLIKCNEDSDYWKTGEKKTWSQNNETDNANNRGLPADAAMFAEPPAKRRKKMTLSPETKAKLREKLRKHREKQSRKRDNLPKISVPPLEHPTTQSIVASEVTSRDTAGGKSISTSMNTVSGSVLRGVEQSEYSTRVGSGVSSQYNSSLFDTQEHWY